jgi:glycosyltransferase involved in cell wall biosynthesis
VSEPRRVLYLDHIAAMGGGEIALLHLARQLDRKNYIPVVALLSDGPLAVELKAAGIETHIVSVSEKIIHARKDALGGGSLLKLGAALAATTRLTGLIRHAKADIVHANSLKSDILGGLAARLARRPVIWHVRDRIENDYLPPKAVKLFRKLARILPRHIIANSRATLDTLHLRKESAASVIYSGLDLNPYLNAAASTSAVPTIGIIGRIARWKGQHVFLRAAAIVKQRFPNAVFQVVGTPLFEERDYEAEIHELANRLGIADSVQFLGFRNDVLDLISRMEVLVHASITAEPFGQVVVIGMAAGKPVVATAGGGVLEIITDGENGLLAPMNDAPAMAAAIERILKNPPLAAELGRKARAHAIENFTIEKTAAQTMDLYDRLLAARGY